MRLSIAIIVGLFAAVAGTVHADEPKAEPRPVPLTRPEMKQYLEDMKERKPRIPLPELTEEEKAKLGERASGYESRLRALYMPESGNRGGGHRPLGYQRQVAQRSGISTSRRCLSRGGHGLRPRERCIDR